MQKLTDANKAATWNQVTLTFALLPFISIGPISPSKLHFSLNSGES